jgi:hypothetical protein
MASTVPSRAETAPITRSSNDGGAAARQTQTYPSHSRAATGTSPRSERSTSGILARLGAAASRPFNSYDHA